ncbi:7-deoxyloganetin glucosyltransferase-like [Pyrus ussuriensis x Pyrus communis]|uniref:7-deoxyloganetin glucosyltransferase-like n=1 Tax=Pyrus ussuriensis x Pyrus communis TaxID=2448454 RepID=A0A5N5G634_9ROSA|nr:7-deoxyloganetin glucosyltransferase-like [Pyrus ussuriensis x Pyrus communis]
MTPEQLVEFGWGLANSKLTFFWVIRPDLVIGGSAILPLEFVDETKGRSLIAGCCKEWGIGMEIDNKVKRDELEKLVRELMEGEKGKKMKNKAMEWKTLAEEATGSHGSSSTNLENLVNQIQLRKR